MGFNGSLLYLASNQTSWEETLIQSITLGLRNKELNIYWPTACVKIKKGTAVLVAVKIQLGSLYIFSSSLSNL